MRCLLFLFALHFSLFSSPFTGSAAEPPGDSDSVAREAESVAREVRSILSNRCFACHGPDENERQANLRFDDRTSFVSESDSGEMAVRPGNSADSELLRRLVTDDESERMPPEDFGARLSASEIELIATWIDQGAKLPQHWSFVPPVQPALPDVSSHSANAAWASHPVDRFVLSQLVARGLHPSAPASKAELLRRLSLDLTGLPPTLDELHAFEADLGIDAYEKQVDRLLASPEYGEHWARKWLDLARYADSAGYADDPARTIWAYRDWVINALNDNQPIDQFTIDQIAGDLLPNPTQEQLIATAFHRNTLTNNEGGTNDEEFRNVAIVDRVNTTMAVWMGVTMACAQCHTHKYDPFTHEEYFRLFAIFNQSQDADRRDESPLIELFTVDQWNDKRQWEAKLLELRHQLETPSESVLKEFSVWDQSLKEPTWNPLTPNRFEAKSKSDVAFTNDKAIVVKPIGNNIVTDTYTLDLDLAPAASPIHAIGIRTMPSPDLPQGGAGLGGGNFVVTEIRGTLTPVGQRAVEAKFLRVELPGDSKILSLAEVQLFSATENIALGGTATQSTTAFDGEAARAIDGNTNGDYQGHNSTTHTETSKDPWWELDLQQPQTVERIVLWNRTDNGLHTRLDGAKVLLLDENREPLFSKVLSRAPATSEELAISFSQPIRFKAAYADFEQPGFPAAAVVDGEKASGWAVAGQIDVSHLLTLIPEKPITVDGDATFTLTIEHNSPHRHHLLGSFRVEATLEENAADWSALTPELQAIQSKAKADRSAGEASQLVDFFNQHIAQATSQTRSEMKELTNRISQLKPATSVPVMRDLQASRHRETFVQIRGNYKSLGKQVEPGTPQVFHPVAYHTPDRQVPDRLDLARWLVDDRNPLTARVWVNRLWESLFGIGIVRSSEEFGSQGDRPTHPDLLDWLACEFMQEGWDNKRILRLLVTSQTYQQTSMVSRELLETDRDNIWLARGPRVRLSAEMIRDQSLHAAGLLSHVMFGEPVRPPQPNLGLKAAFGSGTDWSTSEGEDRYRRGLYTTWRRSNPYPSMATFDAPSREVCILRRDSTNTPLQALVTLNDPAFVEAAQALARRVALKSGLVDDAQKLSLAFELCTSRRPTPDESRELLSLLEHAKQQLSADKKAASDLATNPLGELPPGADVIELAAWTATCNVLLNLDEVLMKR